MRVLLHSLFFIFFLSSCSTGTRELEPPLPPERSNAYVAPSMRPAITQVRQTLNLEPDETFQAAMRALERRSVRVVDVDRRNGTLETEWVSMTDSVCNGARRHNAPLPCRTKMSVKVEAVELRASALNIRYQELCSYNEEISLECPDSAAERLMVSVIDEVRDYDVNR